MYLRIVRDMFFPVRVITTEGSAIFLLIALFSTFVVIQVDIGFGEKCPGCYYCSATVQIPFLAAKMSVI